MSEAFLFFWRGVLSEQKITSTTLIVDNVASTELEEQGHDALSRILMDLWKTRDKCLERWQFHTRQGMPYPKTGRT